MLNNCISEKWDHFVTSASCEVEVDLDVVKISTLAGKHYTDSQYSYSFFIYCGYAAACGFVKCWIFQDFIEIWTM